MPHSFPALEQLRTPPTSAPGGRPPWVPSRPPPGAAAKTKHGKRLKEAPALAFKQTDVHSFCHIVVSCLVFARAGTNWDELLCATPLHSHLTLTLPTLGRQHLLLLDPVHRGELATHTCILTRKHASFTPASPTIAGGNTSSSSIWYELRYVEEHSQLRRGHKIMQLAFGCARAFFSYLTN